MNLNLRNGLSNNFHLPISTAHSIAECTRATHLWGDQLKIEGADSNGCLGRVIGAAPITLSSKHSQFLSSSETP